MNSQPNLHMIARRIMKERGFRVDFSPASIAQAQATTEPSFTASLEKDLSDWLWSSIDNDDSRDLDQIEYAREEPRGTRLFVAIADVNRLVPRGSAIDTDALQNTCSIYTGVETFPMLPLRLSTDLTSLLEGQKRFAVVTEMLIDGEGRTLESSVYPAIVQNKAQLTYTAAAHWIEQRSETPSSPLTLHLIEKIRQSQELQTQLSLQDRVAQALQTQRQESGALSFGIQELQPRFSPNGEIHLDIHETNRATQLIENLMIAANRGSVAFLEEHGFPSLQRVVRTPKRWDRIVDLAHERGSALPAEPDVKALQKFLAEERQRKPDDFADLSLAIVKLLGRGEYVVHEKGPAPLGHFGLAIEEYSHSTAPNRRYPDVITQRLLLAASHGQEPPYSRSDLESLARHCTEKEDDVNRVERSVRKSIAAVALSHRIGEQFPARITGASEKGVWVRLRNPPIEGKLQGPSDVLKKLDVGANVSVELISTDPDRGFIDFKLMKG